MKSYFRGNVFKLILVGALIVFSILYALGYVKLQERFQTTPTNTSVPRTINLVLEDENGNLSSISSLSLGRNLHPASPSELSRQNVTQDGFYWYLAPVMSQSVNLFTRFNWIDGRAWVRVFSSPAGSPPTTNAIGLNIPWTGFLIQQSNGTNQTYSYMTETQLFNTRNNTTVSTGGNKSGFRFFIGLPGGHGFYNTSQLPCNWASGAIGSVGAGFDGTCGTFPDNIKWGIGTSSTIYNLSPAGTVWETWITW
jgi:hypothetical protein